MLRSARTAAAILLLVAALTPAAAKSSTVRVVYRSPADVFVREGTAGLDGFDVELFSFFLAWVNTRRGGDFVEKRVLVDSIPQLLDEVREERCDVALGSITITEERATTVDFSRPYLPIRVVLFARSGRLPDLPWQQAMEGRVVGAIVGSEGARRTGTRRGEIEGLELRTFSDYERLFGALLSATPEIDAVATDVTHYWALSQEADLVLVAPLSEEQGLGAVFPKSNELLRPLFDEFLEDFTHAPSYFLLVRRYFGSKAEEMLTFARQGK